MPPIRRLRRRPRPVPHLPAPAARTAALPTRALSLATPQQQSQRRLVNAVDRLIADEGRLYDATGGYVRLDLRNEQHRQLLYNVRSSVAVLRDARRGLQGLGVTPLYTAPRSKKKTGRVPIRISTTSPMFRPARPPIAVPGRPNRMLGLAETISNISVDLDSAFINWPSLVATDSTATRIWRSRSGVVFRGTRNERVRSLLYALKTAMGQMQRLSFQPERERRGALSDVVLSDSSRLLWLMLGITAGYVMFNAATT